jgi:hypothetical protein
MLGVAGSGAVEETEMQARATIGHQGRVLVGAGSLNRRAGSQRRVATIAAALIVESILILGVVIASLGLGYEGQTRVGPDRPTTPVTTPAPAPPPELPSVTD